MVLPILLGAAAAGAAVFGAKEGVEAALSNTQASTLRKQSEAVYENASKALENSRKQTAHSLELLGQQKLNTWDKRLGRFVQLYGQLKNVELTGQAGVSDLAGNHFTHEELAEMKQLSFQAHEVLLGGTAALGTGALAGIASYGGAMMFATASTGTAIGTLSGAAATNATLAWFGGGSLASGGLGMAGGMMVLGGLVTGPILAVGGMVMNGKAQQNLAQAKKDAAKVVETVEEIQTAVAALEAIQKVVGAFQGMIIRLGYLMEGILNDLEQVIQDRGTNYRSYSLEQKHVVYLSVQCAQVLKLILETPLLTPEGQLREDYLLALEKAQEFDQEFVSTVV